VLQAAVLDALASSVQSLEIPLKHQFILACVLWHVHAFAQPPSTQDAAPGASAAYTSIWAAGQGFEADIQPTDWVQANADTGRYLRGHIDILKAESAAERAVPSTKVPDAAEPLSPAQAWRMALRQHPELMASTRLSALERLRLDAEVQQLARQVYRAWLDAVAARQNEAHGRSVHGAALSGVRLGQRMASVGNWSRKQVLQEQLLLSAAATELAAAQQQAFATRESLVRLLGWTADPAHLQLPNALPPLPATPLSGAELEATALRKHPALPVVQAQARLARLSVNNIDLQRWADATEAALPATTPDIAPLSATAPVVTDPSLSNNHPLVAAVTAQAQARALELNTRSQVREAYYRYRTALDVARHLQDDGVRISTALQEETQARYNGMLQSTWELLASARERVQSVQAALQAQRNFWLAHIDLQAVLTGGDLGPAPDSTPSGNTRNPQGH
jgi:hypothetical protein